jgi:hypothetical protein
MAYFLCIAGFLLSYYIGRRSLWRGLVVVFTVGYFYGILRANYNQAASHFIFDAAVAGLYFAQLLRLADGDLASPYQRLLKWCSLLVIWPFLLALLPIQDPLVQLVGFRANVFLLGFMLFGVRLRPEERWRVGASLALLNVVVFCFALYEFFYGLESLYPHNEVTELIYRSNDVAGFSAYRIPATFTSAHAYAGTMVMGMPLLVYTWFSKETRTWQTIITVLGFSCALVGVFMSAARTHAAVLFLLLIVATLSLKMRPSRLAPLLAVVLAVGWVVLRDERLQRFSTLQDVDHVSFRLGVSVNADFAALFLDYPMGNGLGGGGTSIPYFLQDRISNPVGLESEYSRILLEQGIPGLLLWVGFIFWVLLFAGARSRRSSVLGRRLAWYATMAYFVVGLTGLGLLTSIPQTTLLMLSVGWIVAPETPAGGRAEEDTSVVAGPPHPLPHREPEPRGVHVLERG